MRRRPLLVVRHVAWEGPHRILDAFAETPTLTVDVLECDTPLPEPAELCGAVFMGGPMSVTQTREYPRLAEEIDWLREAVAEDLPVLGVCLGSQLLACALGARVRPGVTEIGCADVEVFDAADPVVGALAPTARVLHWHEERFDLPPGARLIARSAATDVQAFRSGNAWGLLFHAEVDEDLIDLWLTEPSMAEAARRALGPDYAERLRREVRELAPDLAERVFAAFSNRCVGR